MPELAEGGPIQLEGTQNLAVVLLILLGAFALLFGYLFYRATVRPCASRVGPPGLPEKPKFR